MKRFIFTILLMALCVVFIEPVRNVFSTLLRLDAPKSYDITSGDWLSKIAKRNYGDASYWRELALVNRAPNADVIFPEEEVLVPSYEAIVEIRKAKSLSEVNRLVDNQRTILTSSPNGNRQSEPLTQNNTRTPDTRMAPVEPAKPGVRDEQPVTTPETQSDPYASQQTPRDEEAMPQTNGNAKTNGDFEEAENDMPSPASMDFWTSTLVLTGIAVLAVILVIAFIMYRNKKKREEEEVTYYGRRETDRHVEEEETEEEDERKEPNFLFGRRETEPEDEDEKSSTRRRTRKEDRKEEMVH